MVDLSLTVDLQLKTGRRVSRALGGPNLCYDLDNVLRDLTAGIGYHPQHWDAPTPSGLGLVDHINKNMEILLTAPPTIFVPMVAAQIAPVVLTCQQPNWIKHTKEWILRNIPNAWVYWCADPDEKLCFVHRQDSLLLEDYPFFQNNSRIILVDRPYNRKVQGCYARVRTPAELTDVLKDGKKLYRFRNHEEGLCLRCPQKATHWGYCRECWEKNKKHSLNSMTKKRRMLNEEKRCTTCGAPLDPEIDENYKNCVNCRMGPRLPRLKKERRRNYR